MSAIDVKNKWTNAKQNKPRHRQQRLEKKEGALMSDQERKEKFTPGPWQAYAARHAAWVATDWKDCAEQTNICDCDKDNGWNDVHLIAAAPEMYEFVKMFATIDGQILGKGLYKEAVRLVKKARGEE